MCRQYPVTCALRDDHVGVHLSAAELEETVRLQAQALDREINAELNKPAQDSDQS